MGAVGPKSVLPPKKIYNKHFFNQSIIYLNQAEAHKNRLDRQGSMRKITKLEKNGSKLELLNKNCSYTQI